MTENIRLVVSNAEPAPRSEAEQARLERMYAAHHVTVWRTLRRRGLTPDAAADATQEAFLIAARRVNDIHPDSERAFLIGTALRAAHTLRRKTVRLELDENLDRHASGAGSDGEDLELCDRALAKIKPELIDVFVLYEIEGLSSPEIAALLEIPLGSVASRLRRAREQFRAAVARIEREVRRHEGPP